MGLDNPTSGLLLQVTNRIQEEIWHYRGNDWLFFISWRGRARSNNVTSLEKRHSREKVLVSFKFIIDDLPNGLL